MGAAVDPSQSTNSVCHLPNKTRVSDMTMDTELRNDCVPAAARRTTRGRLVLVRACTFGRFGDGAFFTLGKVSKRSGVMALSMTRAQLFRRS